MYECLPDGKVYRLPMSNIQEVNRQVVLVAELMVNKERRDRKSEEMMRHMLELHKPKMPEGMCPTCDETRVVPNRDLEKW